MKIDKGWTFGSSLFLCVDLLSAHVFPYRQQLSYIYLFFNILKSRKKVFLSNNFPYFC